MSNTAWTEELKQQAIDMYKAAEPTPQNSAEIVKDIADQIGMSANGVRLILSSAQVYIKKDAAAAKTASGASASGEKKTTRVSKEDQLTRLREIITERGKAVDDEIISKLTGKAAQYFISILTEE